MTTHKQVRSTEEALTALVHEMEYVLSCINADKVPFDGDDFHEALRLGKEALSQTENDKERCVGCEACIDTACGRDECPKGWPKAAQPEQEPVAWQRDIKTGRRFMPHGVLPSVGKETGWTPLYTTPPPVAEPHKRTWVGLTDDERRACMQSPFITENYRSIEALLKEKNTRNGGCL